jgi:hypothetical protein
MTGAHGDLLTSPLQVPAGTVGEKVGIPVVAMRMMAITTGMLLDLRGSVARWHVQIHSIMALQTQFGFILCQQVLGIRFVWMVADPAIAGKHRGMCQCLAGSFLEVACKTQFIPGNDQVL